MAIDGNGTVDSDKRVAMDSLYLFVGGFQIRRNRYHSAVEAVEFGIRPISFQVYHVMDSH